MNPIGCGRQPKNETAITVFIIHIYHPKKNNKQTQKRKLIPKEQIRT